ncbi:MAG: potassium channel protein [Deltaproteobacteria bacterium]|nr:potassium channel protein [Deltaproteobacteria bacterium]
MPAAGPPKPAPSENQRIRRAALQGAVLLLAIHLFGIVGYQFVEGWSWFDALYMTVITIATVGYGEVHTLSSAGRALTIALIFAGVGVLGFMFAEGTDFMARGGLQAYRRRDRMSKMLNQLGNHTIVAGYGRLGTALVEELLAQGTPFVVVDRDPHTVEKLQANSRVAALRGDANDDAVLRQAGIDRAHALVCALSDDASNVFLTLTARVLTRESNPRLVIHAKVEDPSSLTKLERAGANFTFCPSRVLGHRIAHQILRPATTELVGLSTRRGDVELAMEETLVQKMGPARTLRDTPLWGKADVLILAVKTEDGDLVFPSKGDMKVGPGDRVVVLGKTGVLDEVLAQRTS